MMKHNEPSFVRVPAGWLAAVAAVAVIGFAAAPLFASMTPAAPGPRWTIAQAGQGGNSNEVSPTEVQKYVAVYAAMQKDHSLTIAQAAKQQGFTVAQFRALENRIMSNPALHEMVRQQLAAPAAHPTPTK